MVEVEFHSFLRLSLFLRLLASFPHEYTHKRPESDMSIQGESLHPLKTFH